MQRHFESFLNGPKKIEDNFEVKSKDLGQMEGGKMLEMLGDMSPGKVNVTAKTPNLNSFGT